MLAFICIYENKIKISNLFLVISQGFTMFLHIILPAETQDHIVFMF